MQYFWIFCAVVTSGLSGLFYKKVSLAAVNKAAAALLPIAWFLPISAVFGAVGLLSGGLVSAPGIVLPALLSGLSAAVCSFSLIESMKRNSYSIAVIIVNLSFVFPVVFSLIFLKEKAGILQLIGMLAAVIVILFMNGKSEDGKAGWYAVLLAALSSLGNGMIDFSIKLQQYNTPGENEASFFFFSYLFASAVSLLMYFLFRAAGQKAEFDRSDKKSLVLCSGGIAASNGICFLAVSLLAGVMNAAAEFTVITSLSIVLSLVFGWVYMKEKVNLRVILSLVFCAAAIVCQYLNLA